MSGWREGQPLRDCTWSADLLSALAILSVILTAVLLCGGALVLR